MAVYTTYISKVKDVPKTAFTIYISAFLPPGILDIVNSRKNSHWIPELSPSKEKLYKWKDKTISWEEFTDSYNQKIQSDANSTDIRTLLNIIHAAEKLHEDVFLICYEKDAIHCHRTLLARYISELEHIEIKEWGN